MPPVIPTANLNFGDRNDLGQVLVGIPCDADRLSDVNHLIDMVLGGSDRSAWSPITRGQTVRTSFLIFSTCIHEHFVAEDQSTSK